MKRRMIVGALLGAIGLAVGATADEPAPPPMVAAPVQPVDVRNPTIPDLTKQPTLFTVGYAHLDTEWRWAYPQTIREFVKATLDENFPLFEKYPHYIFNFSGSRRYQMMKEYYPEQYDKLKDYVAAGRWFPCGSSVDENDANVPSGESFIRHILYGNRFFRREFGVASDEFMLPDCFGFPASLPSLLAHCGLTGFSTQKLTWGSAVPIPFKVGMWYGPDWTGVVAALDPGSYSAEVLENLSNSRGWLQRIGASGSTSGVLTDYHYYGTGDQGGSPTERSVAMIEESVNTDGAVRVISSQADWMFKAITPEMKKNLPTYRGELLLTEHSAGSITSQAYMKRWNRKNELLADAAERAAVVAWWLGGAPYPAQRLEDAWTLVLGSQMHDILPGTSLPKAYEYAWNDEVLAANMFEAVLTKSVEVVGAAMDTSATGTPVIVYNPLSIEREDVVEVELRKTEGASDSFVVVGPSGQEAPTQVIQRDQRSVRVAFLAKVPSVGFAVYDVRPGVSQQGAVNTSLSVDNRRIENERYSVTVDDNGDVSAIHDKKNNRELLSGPARLGLHFERPRRWPAWNMDWTDRQQPAREFVGGPAKITVAESGPVRVALRIERELGGSTFIQTVRLAAGGAGDRVEFDTQIDWTARERSLKAAFPLAVSNPKATYEIQVGTIERDNNNEKRYENPSHQWVDLSDAKDNYGVTLINDCKYGSDKPDDRTLRLTLLYTPGVRGDYQDQGTQDIGRHHVLYALYGHMSDWRVGRSSDQAARVNQPLLAFATTAHDGKLRKSVSMLSINEPNVRLVALKKAEASDEAIIRVREMNGLPEREIRIDMCRPMGAAREVDGQERGIGDAGFLLHDGTIKLNISEYSTRSFAARLGGPPARVTPPGCTPIELPFDTDVVSTNSNRSDGAMDASGLSIPAEQFPREIIAGGVNFRLGAGRDGEKNAVVCRGQEIALPDGPSDHVWILAAATGEDARTEWPIGGTSRTLTIQKWNGFVGQWDNRLWSGEVPESAYVWNNELAGLEPGFVKRDPVAWYCSHMHAPTGDQHYQYCYLFVYALDVPPGAKSVRLPRDERVRIFAMTTERGSLPHAFPAQPLFDRLDDRSQDAPRFDLTEGVYSNTTAVRILPRLYWRVGAIRYTLDGTDPTASSPAFDPARPMYLNRTTEIRAAVVDATGKLGPIARVRYAIEDTTPPVLTGVRPQFQSTELRVQFSEPVATASATDHRNYGIDPPIGVTKAVIGADPRAVTLTLANTPEAGTSYRLTVRNVLDMAPSPHAIAPAPVEFAVRPPILRMAKVASSQFGTEIGDVKGLPVKGTDSWTINLFARTDNQPENRTVIAGFGRCTDADGTDGTGRYLCKFSGGAHLWSRNGDAKSSTPLDLGAWQMLSATYDGETIRLYKNGEQVGERRVKLADDEPVVRIAPPDAWEKRLRFEGEIAEFTIWDTALETDSLRSLMSSMPKPGG